jgi:hypothetical protein
MTISLISAGCIFGGALLGLFLQGLLPEHHLRDTQGHRRWLPPGSPAGAPHSFARWLAGVVRRNEYCITQRAKIILLDRVLAM